MKVNTKLGTIKDIPVALTTAPVNISKEVDVRNCVTIKAYIGNAAPIYIGDRDRQSFSLPAGASISYRYVKLNDIYMIAESGTAIALVTAGSVVE